MVLENVKEMWTEKPKGGKGRGVNKDRFISKMFVSPASIREGFVCMGFANGNTGFCEAIR